MSMRFYYNLLYRIVWPFFCLCHPIRAIGRENIPEGGCVVCPNHVQLSDPPFAAVALGAWTVLPEFVLKVDYGRYLYSIVFYYLAMILSLTALGDGQVKDALGDMEARLTKKMYAPAILIVYPMILMPFLDVVISQINVVLCGFMPSLMEW